MKNFLLPNMFMYFLRMFLQSYASFPKKNFYMIFSSNWLCFIFFVKVYFLNIYTHTYIYLYILINNLIHIYIYILGVLERLKRALIFYFLEIRRECKLKKCSKKSNNSDYTDKTFLLCKKVHF